MRISQKTVYGLQALFEIASHPNLEGLKSVEIAEAQGIPVSFLEQILTTLKKSGLVKSFRGRSGGYILSRPADEVTLLDTINALEGPISFSKGLEKGSAVSGILKGFEDKVIKSLKEVSIESLIEEKRKKDRTFIYSI